MTMTKVGGETSVTSGDAMIIGSGSQTEKSTTTTSMADRFEATTTSRQQSKTSLTTTEVVVATPVTDDDRILLDLVHLVMQNEVVSFSTSDGSFPSY